jgi:hypothetical protein
MHLYHFSLKFEISRLISFPLKTFSSPPLPTLLPPLLNFGLRPPPSTAFELAHMKDDTIDKQRKQQKSEPQATPFTKSSLVPKVTNSNSRPPQFTNQPNSQETHLGRDANEKG